MQILVINSGSSSIKFSRFALAQSPDADPGSVLEGEISGVGGDAPELTLRGPGGEDRSQGRSAQGVHTAEDAIGLILDAATGEDLPRVEAVGYRVVHPGPDLHEHVEIDDAVIRQLEAAAPFAPLHDPEAVKVIRAGRARLPATRHFACFDTVFHETMSEPARTYPLPAAIRDKGVHRYGFHGLSCESIVCRLHREGVPVPPRMVIAHLGSGCSVTALLNGRSVDTSMGLTPTGGVVMGTRPGDLDPGLVLYLVRQAGGSREEAARQIEQMLNHDSGLHALSDLPNDVKAVRKAAAAGDAHARLALAVFTRSVRKAIGAYAWLLGGLDAVVFSGGIGEHDAETRAEILSGLEREGVHVSSEQNAVSGPGVRPIHTSGSSRQVLVVPAEEDLMIAVHVARMAVR